MIIENMIIYDYIDKKIKKFDFDSKNNIFVSENNTVGKSSLMKSIYHCLGYNIKIWPDGWNINNMIFQLMVSNGDQRHTITRQKNLFYIDGNKEILTEKEYSIWLQNFINIFIKIRDKKNKQLTDVYASEVLLPFYIDQDKSWNGFIHAKSSDTFARYGNTVKYIFDFYFGIANKQLIELEIEKSTYENKLNNTIKKIEALNLLDSEHTIQAPEKIINIIDNPEEVTQHEIDTYLKKVNLLNNSIAEIDNKIIEIDTKVNNIIRENLELNKLKDLYNKKFKEIKHTCSYCNSNLTPEQSITRLKIRNNLYEIDEQILKNKSVLDDYQNEKDKVITKKDQILIQISKTEQLLKETGEYEELDSYIEDRIKQGISQNYMHIEQKLFFEQTDISNEIKGIIKNINKEKKLGSQRKSNIKKRYEELINTYEKYFKEIKIDDIKFYSFKEVSGSGMDANQKMLALYTLYSNLIDEFSDIKIPFAMDSFIKNETDSNLKELMFSFLSKYYLSTKNQTFFSIIKQNVKYLDQSQQYHYIYLEKPILDEVNKNNEFLTKEFDIQ